MNPGAAGPASGICIAVFSFYALWLALDTPRALSAMARVLGAAYFWLPGRRRIVAGALQRNLRFAWAWRALGLAVIAGDILTLAWLLAAGAGMPR